MLPTTDQGAQDAPQAPKTGRVQAFYVQYVGFFSWCDDCAWRLHKRNPDFAGPERPLSGRCEDCGCVNDPAV